MPVASGKRFAAGPQKVHCPMPAPDETPKIEGTVDKTRAKSQDDSISRRPWKGAKVNTAGPPKVTVEKPPMYGGRRR